MGLFNKNSVTWVSRSCPHCNGMGSVPHPMPPHVSLCEPCNGTGKE